MVTAKDEFFLWHLEHIGVIETSGDGWKAPLWDDAKASKNPVTVAIVDSGLDPKHPNIAEAMIGPQVDFSPRITGAIYAPLGDADDTAPVQPDFDDVDTQIAALGLGGDHKARISAMSQAIANPGYAVIDVADPARYFGAHGTACAGLVGGRPPVSAEHPFYSALPYYGVNPYCRIRSFATPYSHEIKPVTHALLAAYLSGAEVILMPRGVPDVATRGGLDDSPRRATRIETRIPPESQTVVDEDQAVQTRLEDESALFETLLKAIAEKRYLVLAAGNDSASDMLAYPASVMADNPDAIIVGAVNRDGKPSAYTNGHTMSDRVINLVSDDAQALSRDGLRLDTDTREGSDFDYSAHFPEDTANDYSPWAPLSLDVRGSYGFAASGQLDPPENSAGVDIGSLYTLFGGTSAASSLAAGAVSLLMQAGKLPEKPENRANTIRDAMIAEGILPTP